MLLFWHHVFGKSVMEDFEYSCFESFYKNGEVKLCIISSPNGMKDYCVKKLQDHGMDKDTIDDFESSHTLESLIDLTIRKGNKEGWGLKFVVRGNNLMEL